MELPIILLSLLGLYALLILGPAVVSTVVIFARTKGRRFTDAMRPDSRFAPYAARMAEARDALLARMPQTVEVTSEDGLRLRGSYFDLGAEKTVLFLHGYRTEAMLNFAVQAEVFAKRGWNLLLIDQRGCGKSDGRHVFLGRKEYRDVPVWVGWITEHTDVKTVVVYGMSMGAACAGYSAPLLDAPVRALILDCGFTSPYAQIVEDCRKRHLPRFLLMPPIRLLSRLFYGVDIRVPVPEALSQITLPAFFLHGTADETVPYAQGQENYSACAAPKAFFTAEGADHTLAFLHEPEQAEAALFAFLAKHGIS